MVITSGGDYGGDDTPPPEYVEGGEPVYYDSNPGVAYYPVFINTPGSCYCILPVRQVRGLWLDVDGRVIHRGHLPYYHPEQSHRDAWQRNQGIVNGHVPLRGSLIRDGDRFRPVPPRDSIHEHRREQVRPAERSWERPVQPRPAVIVEPARPLPSVRQPPPAVIVAPPVPIRTPPEQAPPMRQDPRQDHRREREPARPDPVPAQARPEPRKEQPREERRGRPDRVRCSDDDRRQHKCD